MVIHSHSWSFIELCTGPQPLAGLRFFDWRRPASTLSATMTGFRSLSQPRVPWVMPIGWGLKAHLLDSRQLILTIQQEASEFHFAVASGARATQSCQFQQFQAAP